ncbi:MAG: hypothetical protein Q9182_007369 [Xanthomendoza sp. 2 TL-2023]
MNLNRKDTPAPHAARKPHSPPRTPRTGNKRSSRTHKTPRDFYFDGLTDNARGPDGDDAMRNKRISHDLSLTANIGRSSVVDSMLLSLNPDQSKFESSPYPRPSCFTSPESPRSRGHLPSSSLNSTYSFPSTTSEPRPDSKRSAHLPRGHRSNSSNCQSLSRIDSLTTDEEKVDSRRAQTYQSQRARPGGRTSVPASRSGGKSSKSSGSSSVDFGHMMRQSALPRRSASFDNGQRRPSFPITSSSSQPIIYSNTEAAPTPNIPSGPRAPAIVPSAPAQPSTISNKRPFRGQDTKRNKIDGKKGSLEQKTEVLADSHEISAPTYRTLRATSPAVDRHDSLVSQQRRPSQSREHAKERPGFFRRVFMSSRHTNIMAQDLSLPASQPQSHRNSIRVDSQAAIAPPPKLSNLGLPGGITQLPREAAPPPLNKKPSSFFRRRKKSISEPNVTPVPMPATHSSLHPPNHTMKQNPSVSSLRELMSPYLSTSPGSRKGSSAGHYETPSRNQRVPFEKSTIKPVFPSSAIHKSTTKSPAEERQTVTSTSGDAPSAKADASSEDNLLHPHDQSFLHDNSSNETRLNASDPSPTVVAKPSTFETPMNSHARHHGITENELERSAAFSDGTVRSARPTVDLMPSPSGKRGSARKLPRPRTASGDQYLLTLPTDQAASANPTSVKETLIAAVTPDETTPRVWLRPEKSTEDLRGLAEISIPIESDRPSHANDERPPSSRRGRIVTAAVTAPEVSIGPSLNATSPDFDVTLPLREDKVLAQRVYEADETLITKAKAAAWLGEAGPDRARARRAYMELFDWQNLNILAALRDFCGRLLLKGETQQVDRVLDAFSSRWCACNPNHGFKATG